MEPTTIKYSEVVTNFKHSITDQISDSISQLEDRQSEVADEQSILNYEQTLLRDAYTHLQDVYTSQQVKLNLAMGISVTSLVTGVVSLIIGLL